MKQAFEYEHEPKLKERGFYRLGRNFWVKHMSKNDFACAFICPQCNIPSGNEKTIELRAATMVSHRCQNCENESHYFVPSTDIYVRKVVPMGGRK